MLGRVHTRLILENLRRIDELDYFSREGINPKNEGVALPGINDFFAIYDLNLFIFGSSLSPSK